MTDCAYCDSEVEVHDPVVADRGGEEYPFCNWACLVASVDREDLASGAACEWNPA